MMNGGEYMKSNPIVDKSKVFALRIIRMYKFLVEKRKEFVLSKQVLRSGTSIGANIRESQRGQSKADFYAKFYIALKEADETSYWLELLHAGGYIDEQSYTSIYEDCVELIKLLTSIIKTTKDTTN